MRGPGVTQFWWSLFLRVILMMVKKMRRKVQPKSYSAEERASAVRIVFEAQGSRTILQIAEDLGINAKTLNKWVVNARNSLIDPGGSMSDFAKRRIRLLEADNARLRKDLEFEKKAGAFIRAVSLRRNGSQ